MLFDWFTVIAQIVNFLILAILLKYFLYDRIVEAMEERRKKTDTAEQEASSAKEEAQNRQKEYEKKLKELNQEKKGMIQKAKDEAKEEKEKILEQAKKEHRELKDKLHGSLEKEKDSMLDEISDNIVDQTKILATRIIKELSGSDMQSKVSKVFTQKLKDIDSKRKKRMLRSLKKEDYKAKVTSPQELDKSDKQMITRSVRENISEKAQINYEIDRKLVMGLSLKTNSHKLSWTLEDFLSDLDLQGIRDKDKEDN